ncbi:cupin domain-containing protein [Haloglomus litoreum]|uniref:cupin domain-containing protein n=1 Tax=Haloglomus litoreum TaxID=3034026 RepID=UPI0023E8177E|nr:cupin domain-containing protein [Haloglomus sp. DT116]
MSQEQEPPAVDWDIDHVSDDLESKFEDRLLRPGWDVHEDWEGEPKEQLQPFVWKWEDVIDTIEQVEEELPYSELEQGLRRSLALTNPASDQDLPSPFLSVFFQTVTPEEEAGSHRHNVNAVRFVVDGNEDTYTAVEGERFPMTDNALITTPNWTWHDHVNESDERTIWIDVLDWPLIGQHLNASVFDDHEQYQQPVDKSQGYYNSQYGRLRPLRDQENKFRDVPPYRYSWDEAYTSITNAAEDGPDYVDDPYDGLVMEYVNPATGRGPTMSTTSFRLQLLEEGQETKTHRHNSTEIYHVVQGSGETQVEDTTLEWDTRDSFVVPQDQWHAHEAHDEETILFVISDQPVFEAFNVHRVEGKDEE